MEPLPHWNVVRGTKWDTCLLTAGGSINLIFTVNWEGSGLSLSDYSVTFINIFSEAAPTQIAVFLNIVQKSVDPVSFFVAKSL